MYAKGLTGWIPGAVVIVAALAAGRDCVRLAWADHEFRKLTREGVERAASLDPGNTLYLTTLAQLAEPAPLLRRAAGASPYDAGVRIRLGLLAESQADLAAAERLLLEAARLSRKYDPRWTLANFYFRRGNQTEFRRWAREALAVSYGDRTPLFDLCAAASDGLGSVAALLPDHAEARLAFARYAAARGRAAEAASVMEQLAERRDSNPDALAGLCRALMNEYSVAAAFRCASAAGLDPSSWWRAADVRGASIHPHAAGGWRITLDGTQPEQAELLSGIVPVTSGRCRLEVKWDGPTTGLDWSVERHAPGGGSLPHVFDAGGAPAVRLTLRYQRPLGSVRQEGAIEIERAGIACAQ